MAEISGNLTLSVVTPEGTLYRGDADFVAVPAWDGELGMLDRHCPLVAKLGIGGLRIRRREETLRYAVRGGFVQVLGNEISLLVTEAVKPEEVDAAALEAEREEVLGALRHPASDEEYEDLLDRRKWVEARRALLS